MSVAAEEVQQSPAVAAGFAVAAAVVGSAAAAEARPASGRV